VQWRAGKTDAVRTVLKTFGSKFAKRVFRKYHLAMSRDEAEEIVLLAIERAWIRRAQFIEAQGAFEAWLWRITDHCAAEVARTPWCKERMCEAPFEPKTLALMA
jgi:DNA-directed RNA polymerase specialized sigma24 family protein